MKTQVRLNSVVPHGVGSSPECGALDLIYAFLLAEFGQDVYRYISINQIGDELSEVIFKEPGNKVHINIRYPVFNDFETKNTNDKNRIRLDVIHTAMLRIAAQEKKLDPIKLQAIKDKVQENDFCFDIVCKTFTYKKTKTLVAKIIVRPYIDCFKYYVSVEQNEKITCEVLIYSGIPSISWFEAFFKFAKWRGEDELILSGKEKEVEIKLAIKACHVEFINLTPYDNPPLFTIMRADLSEQEKAKAYMDWKHSMPPSHLAILEDRSTRK